MLGEIGAPRTRWLSLESSQNISILVRSSLSFVHADLSYAGEAIMYAKKITHLWALLAIGATIISGLPIAQLENDELDCGPWDDETDISSSASFTSISATITPTPLLNQASSTTSSTSLTVVTSTAQASSTGVPSSTNSFVAPINTFAPVAPPSYAFYIQSSSSGSSNGLYASVGAGAGGLATFTANKNSATKFTIDSSGDLVEQSPSQGYVATLNPPLNVQQVSFYAYNGDNSYGRLTCQRQDGEVSCNVGGVSYQAATCGNDGSLYFMKAATAGCTAVKLVPVVP